MNYAAYIDEAIAMLHPEGGLTARDIAAVWPAATLMPPVPIPETLSTKPQPTGTADTPGRFRTFRRIIAILLRSWMKRRRPAQTVGR